MHHHFTHKREAPRYCVTKRMQRPKRKPSETPTEDEKLLSEGEKLLKRGYKKARVTGQSGLFATGLSRHFTFMRTVTKNYDAYGDIVKEMMKLCSDYEHSIRVNVWQGVKKKGKPKKSPIGTLAQLIYTIQLSNVMLLLDKWSKSLISAAKTFGTGKSHQLFSDVFKSIDDLGESVFMLRGTSVRCA